MKFWSRLSSAGCRVLAASVRAACCGLTLLLTASLAHAEKRVALVVGNATYRHAPELANPQNDSADMAALLSKFDFVVLEAHDLDKAGLERSIQDFAAALAGADVGLFYYSGHGIQIGGQNYIVPIDAQLDTAASVDFELVRLDIVHRAMEREARVNIIFLDACRNNPLMRNLSSAMGTRSAGIGRGLSPVEAGVGTLISYSTQPGNIALDGKGRNSPFSAALVRHLSGPNTELSSVLIEVRNDVRADTQGQQVPWEHSSLTSRFYFAPPRAQAEQEAELRAWQAARDSNDPEVIRGFLQRYPQGMFAVVAQNLVAALERQRTLDREMKRRSDDIASAAGGARSGPQAARKDPAQPPWNSFEGPWVISAKALSGCPTLAWTSMLEIKGSAIKTAGTKPGRIAQSGSLEFYFPASTNHNYYGTFTGAIENGSGKGVYHYGTFCSGTFTLKRPGT